MDKKDKEKELEAFRKSLPMDERLFLSLFDYFHQKDADSKCRGNFVILKRYCKKEQLDYSRLTTWFEDYGAFCDYEILANVEEQFEYLKKSGFLKEMRK